MFTKHRKTNSMPLLSCCETSSSQTSAIFVEKNSAKVPKLSLKQFKPNKSCLDKSQLHKKTMNKDRLIQFQINHPKISFTYQSPKNVQESGKSSALKVTQNVQLQPYTHIKTISQVEKVNKLQDSRILVSNRVHHRTNYSELKLQKSEEKTNAFQKQKQDIHSLKTQKMKYFTPREEENKTVNYQKQENKRKNGQQSEMINQQTDLIQQNLQRSKADSLDRKPNQFYSSQNFEVTMKKWKKGNNFNSLNDFLQRKEKHFNKKTVQLNREVYKRGKLFEKVRRLEIKFSENEDQSSSSHHSEVIEDYKSLLVKLQSNKLQDQQMRQI